jgi:V/A-type H+/Na+-transporting ATPase subunit I
MITPMKKITILSAGRDRMKTVTSLRRFGLVHVENVVQKTQSAAGLESEDVSLNKVLSFLDGYRDKKNPAVQEALDDEKSRALSSSLLSLMNEETRLGEKNRALSAEIERVKPLGDFDPAEIKALEEKGIGITLCYVGKKEKEKLAGDESVNFISIKTESRSECIALVNSTLPQGIAAQKIVLPSSRLSDLENEYFLNRKRLEEIEGIYRDSVKYTDALKALVKKNEEEIFFRRVGATVQEEEEVAYISGYIPAEDTDKFKVYCSQNGLGYIIDDPSDEDNPPTLMKHRGFIRYVQPLYDALGLVQGYREMDISLYFLVFMALFFAMILGDAGYGLLLLLGGVALNVKSKKCSDMNALLYIFSGATVVWGALTGTWFGSEIILEKLPFLKIFVIPELTNFPEMFNMDSTVVQNNMMSFCFSIGAIHLGLARALCIFDKIKKKDISLLSDFGWLMNTILLYLLSLYLVVDADIPLGKVAAGVGVGFVLVCLFASCEPGKPLGQGIRESLGSFFTNFLDTISCFSNVMSYIRLFAVGLASLAIAQSFNGMAEGMMSGFTIPLGILILILGHAVNLVMGFLSIIVHGVRLNIMEFSGQVGVEWSGYKYEPFSLKGGNLV